MNVSITDLDGLMIIEPTAFKDQRGQFYETWRYNLYSDIGIKENFIQDNYSLSYQNVIRGMHYQINHPMGQLIWVTKGKIFDVVIDIRKNSETFSKFFTIELDAKIPKQIYMPPGFAHGFCVLSKKAIVNYKCTAYYFPEDEGGIHYQSLDIPWPIDNPIVSDKDQAFQKFNELSPTKLPKVSI